MRLSDIFSTFKNERIGLYVILAVVLIAVGAMMLLRRCQTSPQSHPSQSVETRVERAEALADSLEQLRVDTIKQKARRSKKQVAKSDSAKQPSAVPDRTLDELPQF